MAVHKLTLKTFNKRTRVEQEETIDSDIMAIKDCIYPGFPHVTKRGEAHAYGRFLNAFYDDNVWVTKSILLKRQKARGGIQYE